MSDIPLPEPHGQFLVWNYHAKPDDPVQYRDVWIDDQMHAHAAAVSAADNAALRAELERLTRELANARAVDIHSCHAGCKRAGCVAGRLQERVKVLEYELSEILEWAVKERAPLRDQEIASIRRTLEASP